MNANPLLAGYTPEQIKAAEKRIADTIFRKEILPRMQVRPKDQCTGSLRNSLGFVPIGSRMYNGEHLNLVQRGMGNAAVITESQFKELCHVNTKQMMDVFTFEENMQIAFVPLIISYIAWQYADKVVQYCRTNRLSEYKKLGREVRERKELYERMLGKDLDVKHRFQINSESERFAQECASDFFIFWLQVNQAIKTQHPDAKHLPMLTDAAMCVVVCDFLREHNKRMDEFISTKMRAGGSITNPNITALRELMLRYLGSNAPTSTTTIKQCAAIFRNNLRKIEFVTT